MTPTLKSKRYCQNYNFKWLIPVIHFHRVTGSVVSNGAQGIKRQAQWKETWSEIKRTWLSP